MDRLGKAKQGFEACQKGYASTHHAGKRYKGVRIWASYHFFHSLGYSTSSWLASWSSKFRMASFTEHYPKCISYSTPKVQPSETATGHQQHATCITKHPYHQHNITNVSI